MGSQSAVWMNLNAEWNKPSKNTHNMNQLIKIVELVKGKDTFSPIDFYRESRREGSRGEREMDMRHINDWLPLV